MKRWQAVITYRLKSGGVSRLLFNFEEYGELGGFIEVGPNWNAIVNIEVTLQCSTGQKALDDLS